VRKAVRFAKAHISESRYGAPGAVWSGSSLPMDGKGQPQIPCGDDNKKSKGKGFVAGRRRAVRFAKAHISESRYGAPGLVVEVHDSLREEKRNEIQGSFTAFRMTTFIGRG
jgi:hypothetical protein